MIASAEAAPADSAGGKVPMAFSVGTLVPAAGRIARYGHRRRLRFAEDCAYVMLRSSQLDASVEGRKRRFLPALNERPVSTPQL